jgi:hypothetical protein
MTSKKIAAKLSPLIKEDSVKLKQASSANKGNELATHPGLLTPIDGIVEDPQPGHRGALRLISMQQGSLSPLCAMCSSHRIPWHLVFGPGVWVGRDAEHNQANLLAWYIANRNQAAVGLIAEVDHLLL